MSDLFLSFAATIITGTLAIYGIAVSFQLSSLVIDGIKVRALPGVAQLAGLWQTLGIAVVLGGFSFRQMQFVVLGVLLIALRMVLLPLHAPAIDPEMEKPLLVMAILSLGLIAFIRVVFLLSI